MSCQSQELKLQITSSTLCVEDGITDTFAGVIRKSLANAGVASVQDVVAISYADLSTLQHAMSTTDNALANLSLGGKGMIRPLFA